jgi:hypothetical protein
MCTSKYNEIWIVLNVVYFSIVSFVLYRQLSKMHNIPVKFSQTPECFTAACLSPCIITAFPSAFTNITQMTLCAQWCTVSVIVFGGIIGSLCATQIHAYISPAVCWEEIPATINVATSFSTNLDTKEASVSAYNDLKLKLGCAPDLVSPLASLWSA